MRIKELKAAELLKLHPMGCAGSACDLGNLRHYLTPSYRKERCVDVMHRDLMYVVGHWAGLEGTFWGVECSTGVIFRGSLTYIREIISLCSAAVYEPNEVR